MKKRCTTLCLLVLGAIGFLAEASLSRTSDKLKQIAPKRPIVMAVPAYQSYVVEGSFTKRGTACGIEQKDNYSNVVLPLAKQHGVDWRLITAIMAAESSFNPCAKSPKGAMGLMQVMPAVAQQYKVDPKDAFNPEENVKIGVLHLKRLNKRFKGNLKLTVAAYNAGEGNVTRYKGIPPFKETQNYVKKVLGYKSDLTLAKALPTVAAPMKLLKAR
jgi:soluble lytic murein transglycosylase-like protein